MLESQGHKWNLNTSLLPAAAAPKDTYTCTEQKVLNFQKFLYYFPFKILQTLLQIEHNLLNPVLLSRHRKLCLGSLGLGHKGKILGEKYFLFMSLYIYLLSK